ncbi:hypothetical protein TSMEX_004860 [Taenia solium]|eukprot:TsM_000367000 transcript=TsM_000367000 gene=TsM_000367000
MRKTPILVATCNPILHSNPPWGGDVTFAQWDDRLFDPRGLFKPHPAGKSYHCELCNKYFTKSCNLNSHVKAVHKGKKGVANCGLFFYACLGVRAFQCSECQKSFSRNSDLQKHIDAVHKGLRPYECATCQKRFSQKSSLKRHREAVHEGIKAFQCSHCSARFSYDVHLKRHIRAKHKTVSGTATSAAAPSEGVSSSSLPSSPVFQPTSLPLPPSSTSSNSGAHIFAFYFVLVTTKTTHAYEHS